MSRLARLTLPLLRKELVEQAARRRTYVVRVAYATLLFGAFGLFYLTIRAVKGQSMLGMGGEVFSMLMGLQFTGVLLFLPALMSGVLTHEKERDSLGLLLLTDLTPGEILLEKYLGRMATIGSYVLMGLPLLAVAYSLGGLSLKMLVGGVYLLVVTCLQAGAFSLLMSAWCRTSVGAFLATYLAGALFYLAPPLLWVIGQEALELLPHLPESQVLCLFPPALFASWNMFQPLSHILLWSIPALVSTLLFLVLARVVVVRRAFLKPRNHMLRLFKWLDAWMTRLNQVVGGVVLLQPSQADPGDTPVAWREINKKALGQLHYRLRLLVVLMVPTLFILVFAIQDNSYSNRQESLGALSGVLWALAALTLTVKGVNAFSSERTQQTLDVLLTTPMTGREIVKQKMTGLSKLLPLFYVPLITVTATKWWWALSGSYGYYSGPRGERALVYFLFAAVHLTIYPPMLCWFSVWLGLKITARFRAVLILFGALLAWFLIPPVLYGICAGVVDLDDKTCALLVVFSPAANVLITEAGADWGHPLGGPGLPWLIDIIVHLSIWLTLREACLRRADRYLGRAASPAWR